MENCQMSVEAASLPNNCSICRIEWTLHASQSEAV